MTRHTDAGSWDDDFAADDEDRWDDSEGYSDDHDEEEDYQEFLDKEFGGSPGGSRLTRLQYATVIVLLIVFILPAVLYALAALTQ